MPVARIETHKGASTSSIQLLREAGFIVHAPSKNPFVKDRIISMNTSFEKRYSLCKYKEMPRACIELRATSL